ncbi:hypothetical protein SNE40_003079 [Patella caerulea]|uniref:Adenylate kinase n=1 Tax=Patella caerulea TaxID=87958 RepID=A0AAN8KD45_PATCE
MGCASSSVATDSANVKVFHRQKVSIRVGNAVKLLKSEPILIFVFGGPGSKKGRLTNDLAQTFGLKLINVSEMIIEELSKKIEDPEILSLRAKVQAQIKEDPLAVKLIWVTREISKHIDENPKGGYIIDLMPNLKSLVNSAGFVKECSNEMKLFEQKYPISFAINFAVPLDKVVKKKEPECAKPVKPAKDNKKEKDGANVKSDEADSFRTKRRAALFDKNVRPFLDYFQRSERLLTVDTSSGVVDLIWGKICEVFSDLELQNLQNIETVIIFCYKEQDINMINIGSYSMEKIVLKDHLQDLQDPVEKVLKTLCKVIDNSNPTMKAYVVDVADTCLVDKINIDFAKKTIVFVDNESAKLEKYVNATQKTSPCALSFKAVSSTENEVCLFPTDVKTDLAKKIALFMAECREP